MRNHLCSRCHSNIPTSGGYCRKCANAYMREARLEGKFNQRSGPYKIIRVGNKTFRQHRLVLGITDPKIHVHHLDNNGLNNNKDNLIAVSPARHYAMHHCRINK